MKTQKLLLLFVALATFLFSDTNFLAQTAERAPATPPPGQSLSVTASTGPGETASGSITSSLHGQKLTYFGILTLVVGYLATTLIGMFGFVILWRILFGKIDISGLISEPNGSASLSRFQFLIFTFVISLSLLLVILGAKAGPQFPETIPAGIYALLGISAASYVVSKGIQKDITLKELDTKAGGQDYCVPPNDPNAG
jgi:hypothetical protein